jgi:hypothetical protein
VKCTESTCSISSCNCTTSSCSCARSGASGGLSTHSGVCKNNTCSCEDGWIPVNLYCGTTVTGTYQFCDPGTLYYP